MNPLARLPYAALPMFLACGGDSTPATPAGSTAADRDPLDAAWELVGALEGSWKNQLDSGDTLSYEHWSRSDSSHWKGLGCVLIGGDTTFIEDLRIERAPASITYAARISTQNEGQWVRFDLRPAGPDTLLFHNPAHDFPKELRYVHRADGNWRVTVSGGDRSFELHFARVAK